MGQQLVFGAERVVVPEVNWHDGPHLTGERKEEPAFVAKFEEVEADFDSARCERGEKCVCVKPAMIGGYIFTDWNGHDNGIWGRYVLVEEDGAVVAVCEDCAYEEGLV